MSPLRCSRGLPLGGLLTALFCLFAFTHSARTADITTPTPLLNDPVAGLALAADVRDARPAANTELHGLLKIRRRDGSTTNVPIVSRIVLADKSWQAIYQGGPTNQGETLIVTRAAGAPTEYRYAQQGAAPAPLAAADLWQPFAGSDFSLGDLGLEFFHWPKQTLVQNEMRKNFPCHVLESRPAVTNAYGRVLTWVEVETGGVVMAEAYDARNKPLKEFEVKRFKKVNDQWQLQEMEMRNLKDRSRTLLQFDVSEPEAK